MKNSAFTENDYITSAIIAAWFLEHMSLYDGRHELEFSKHIDSVRQQFIDINLEGLIMDNIDAGLREALVIDLVRKWVDDLVARVSAEQAEQS